MAGKRYILLHVNDAWHTWPADDDGEARVFPYRDQAVAWCEANGFAYVEDALEDQASRPVTAPQPTRIHDRR